MSGTEGLHLRPGSDLGGRIDALATTTGERVGAGVLDDLHRRGRRAWAPGRAVDRAWTYDTADRFDLRWWPQGVDTSGGVAAVTWYAKLVPGDRANQGSRVTFYDLGTCRYRHVLLVQPTLVDGVPGLVPLRVHAGGLVWAGSTLHVAATGKGFWTASIDDVLRLSDAAADPERGDTFGYRYVLPVRRAHKGGADDGVDRLRYSFFSRDGDDLVVGEFTDGTASRRFARVPLDPGTSLPVAGAGPEVLGEGVVQMQGVVRSAGSWYATTSHGRARLGSMWTGTPGDLTQHRRALPMGPEDLSHDPATDTFYTVTEHPWARWICAVRRSWFV